MRTPAWFEVPTPLQAAELQYTRTIPPLLVRGREQTIGNTTISAKVLPAIGTAVPERLQVSAPGEIVGKKGEKVYVTSVGSDHIVEYTSPECGLNELHGDEKIAALSGIAAAIWRDRNSRNKN